MPEIDGPALYKQVVTRWPVAAPRALFVSGYADLGPYHDDPMLRGVPVLVKPFTLSDLSLKMAAHPLRTRQALD